MYFVGIVYEHVTKHVSGNVQSATVPLAPMTTIGYICLHEEGGTESFPENIPRRKAFCKVLCTHFSLFLYFLFIILIF